MSKSTEPTAAWLQFVVLVAGGVVAAIISYLLITSIAKVFPTPPELLNLGAAPTAEERAVAMTAKLNADRGNGMVWLALAAGILGGTFALLAGLLQKLGQRTAFAAIAGVVAASGMGCAAGYWMVSYHDSVNSALIGDRSGADIKFLMMHAIGWAMVGLGVGLGFGLLASTSMIIACCRTAVIGAIGGALAGAAYPIVVGVAAPMVNATQPVPEPGVGLVVWLLIPAVVISGILSRSGLATGQMSLKGE